MKDQDPDYLADDVGAPYEANPNMAPPFEAAPQGLTPPQPPPNQAPQPSPNQAADEDDPNTGGGKSDVPPITHKTPRRPTNQGTRGGSGASTRSIRTASPQKTSTANIVSTPAAIPPSVAPLPPADEHAPSTGDGKSAVTPVIYTTTSRPVNPSTRRGSGTSARTIPTPSPVSTPVAILPTITTLPPTDYRRPQAYSVICTVGCHGRYAVEFPRDGLCDFIFLDSLYDGCPDEFGQRRSPSSSWWRFQALAASGIKTQFGISIDTLGIQTFLGHLKNRQKAEVWASQSLWNNNIYHWGIMNLHQVYLQSRPALLKEALEALKEAAEFSLGSPTKTVASYTFLGFYTPLPSGCDLMGQEATSVFMPDAIVVLGHISFQENKIPSLQCVLLPPNIYKIPPSVRANITHAHTFHEACLLAQCLRTQQKIQVPIGVSFTMKGRWYRPKIDDYKNVDIGEYDLFKDCVVSDEDQAGIPATICNQTNTNYTKNLALDNDDITMRTYGKGAREKHAQMFDNRATYLKKFCYAKDNLTEAQFSIAIYDVNFDSSASICPPDKIVGNFTRTQLLYNINTILKTGDELSNLTACMTITS
ncbi:uncharacterized protein [Dermacentor albipictus]|uniref:uncharacterized protein isoform X5 n=1 Tax=Dermacentor albipictus TaxID=60249 RepID=UPI0038FC9F46